MIDSNQIKFLIGQGEGYNLEFKVSYSSKIDKEICAFANANGGKILLGVAKNHEIKGINITDKLKSQIQNLARNLDPSLTIDILEIDNILIIDVPEGVNKPYFYGGKSAVRIGANAQKMSKNEIRRFFQEEGLVLFDEKANIEFDLIEDFNDKNFNFFLEKAKITPILEKQAILENLYLLKDTYLKNAGILLFCNEITKFFLQATITCVLYQSKTKYKILDKKEFDEDIYSNFTNAIIYLQSKLNTEFIIKSGIREEKLELPEEALREALLNSIAHRNYFVSGANIMLEIYSDRVEITNPGGLVKALSKEDLGKRSLSRNNLLFGLMQRMGLVEKVGSGIIRMQNAMKNYALDEPRFDINDNWFTIIFDRPPEWWSMKWAEKKLTKTEIEIITEIKKDPKVSMRILSTILKVNQSVIRKNIKNLKNKKVLKRIGPPKGGYWNIINNK